MSPKRKQRSTPEFDEVQPDKGTIGMLRARRVLGRIEDICAKHRVTMSELLSNVRFSSVVAARCECAYMLRTLGFSWPLIGDMLGRQHSTVLLGARRHAKKNGLAEL